MPWAQLPSNTSDLPGSATGPDTLMIINSRVVLDSPQGPLIMASKSKLSKLEESKGGEYER